MFLDEVLCQLSIINCQLSIDLCAAPGGKSTLLRSALPADCVLYSNEPMQKRASILLENVLKWGYKNHHVTNLYPRDYRKSKMKFDLILCDVPCSGEGMFRKDEATIKEWSPQNVEKCWQLQREIVSEAWACLNDGGILIYSTCTFNTKENEENVRWILSEFDAEVVPIETKPE
jgi:16S rRNA C967 or C1407 C5-methylase (RsmB/RsmF family)